MVQTTINDYREDAELSTKEVAAAICVNEQTVRRWVRTKELAATWIGGPVGYRIRVADVRAMLDRRTTSRRAVLGDE